MISIGVKLPLAYSTVSGFDSLTTIRETFKQNFKMLLLTDPGEKVMDSNFGVGVRTYLFSNYHENVEESIRARIMQQVATYMPPIQIISINFGASPDSARLSINIHYAIPDIGTKDLLEFTI